MSKIPIEKDKTQICWLHPGNHCTPYCVAFTDKSTSDNGCLILDGIYSLIKIERVLSRPHIQFKQGI